MLDYRSVYPNDILVGGWWFFAHPFEKYVRQIGSFPQISGMNITNIGSHHPVMNDPFL